MTKRKKIIIIVSIIVVIAIIIAIILCLAFCKKDDESQNDPTPTVQEHTAEKVSAVEATCSADGNIEYYYCSDCGKYYSDKDCTNEITKASTVISAKGHTEVIDAAVEATCTKTGLTEGKHCSECNTVITAQTEVPALGHDWGEGVITTAATCTEAGEITYTCSRCNETKTETVAATGHKLFWGKPHEPTCTGTGNYEFWLCANCHALFTDIDMVDQVSSVVIPATGHSWDDGVITKEPTSTEAGIRTYTCKNCGATKTEEITATADHTHSWDEGTVTTEATCTADGVKTYTCSGCGETKTETIAATGHSWDEGVVTKEPTPTVAGVRTYTCRNCGTTKTEEIAAMGYSEGLLYAIAADGGEYYILINIGTCTDTAIIVPDVYEGLPVAAIEGEAFSGTDIVSVFIPESVTEIGASAFAGCEKLESVTIGSNVTYIGPGAFEECTSLTSVTFKTTEGWTVEDGTAIAKADLANAATAAKYLTDTYLDYEWSIS